MIDSIHIAARIDSNNQIALLVGLTEANESGEERETTTLTRHGGHGASPSQAAFDALCEAIKVVRTYSPTSVMPYAW